MVCPSYRRLYLGFVTRAPDDTFILRIHPPIDPNEVRTEEEVQERVIAIMQDTIARDPRSGSFDPSGPTICSGVPPDGPCGLSVWDSPRMAYGFPHYGKLFSQHGKLPPQLFLFDLDGTLIDSRADIAAGQPDARAPRFAAPADGTRGGLCRRWRALLAQRAEGAPVELDTAVNEIPRPMPPTSPAAPPPTPA